MTTEDEYRVTDPNTGGAKGQKTERHDLLPADVIRAVATHFGEGAAKYADRNWERGYDWSLSYAALMRHLTAWWEGWETDEEGAHHLDAVIFHAMALRAFTLRGIGNDNRVNTVAWEPPSLLSIDFYDEQDRRMEPDVAGGDL